MDSQTSYPNPNHIPAQPTAQPSISDTPTSSKLISLIIIITVLFFISSGLAIFYFLQSQKTTSEIRPPVISTILEPSPDPLPPAMSTITFGLRNLENKNIGEQDPDIEITAQIPSSVNHQLTSKIEDIYKIYDHDFTLSIRYPYEAFPQTSNELISGEQVYFSPNNIPIYRIKVSSPTDPDKYVYSSTYENTQTGMDDNCRFWADFPDKMQTCYSGFVSSNNQATPWVLIITCEPRTPEGIIKCDQIVNTIQPQVLDTTLTPTIYLIQTYTDQQYGYSITYDPQLWQFRRTYGNGINTQGQTDVISGIDLHTPSNFNAEAIIVVNVLQAHGITDIQSWIDQHETQKAQLSGKSTGLNFLEFDYPSSANPPFVLSKVRYLISDNKTYRIYFSHRAATDANKHLFDVLNTFTP